MAKQKKVKLTKLYVHEALDRSCIISYMFNDWVYEHPVIQQDKKLKKKVEKIGELLGELYQDIGNIDTSKLK